MVTANVAMKNGETKTVYADSFLQLFAQLEKDSKNIVRITGKAILLKDVRQGKEAKGNS